VNTKLICLLGGAVIFVAATVAFASEDGAPKVAHTDRSAACMQEARHLKGAEHEKFVSECVKSHDGVHSQQNRMKTCNLEAGKKDLHGDERRAFMSHCLKG
jgi:hypothetical protein